MNDVSKLLLYINNYSLLGLEMSVKGETVDCSGEFVTAKKHGIYIFDYANIGFKDDMYRDATFISVDELSNSKIDIAWEMPDSIAQEKLFDFSLFTEDMDMFLKTENYSPHPVAFAGYLLFSHFYKGFFVSEEYITIVSKDDSRVYINRNTSKVEVGMSIVYNKLQTLSVIKRNNLFFKFLETQRLNIYGI